MIVDELGAGGMGIVYRARDVDGGTEVALKVLRRSNAEAVRRFKREARVTEGFDPARVARVLEVGETPDGEPFLAMEYIPGVTLRERLRQGSIERGEALRILGEIAVTLGEAHRAGVVHRDVKPENVMIKGDGGVVLLDFGIAKQLEPIADSAQATTQLTSEGMMLGTPAYLAPEQALGNDVAPTVDQFALAVTAYEVLTGKLPWTATEVTRVLAQLLADTPPPASSMNGALPPLFDAVLWRALSKAPGARFPSVEAFAQALQAAERGEGMPSPASQTVEGPIAHAPVRANEGRAPEPPPTRSWLRLGVAGLLVLAVAGGGGALVQARRREGSAPSLAPRAAAAFVVSAESPLACPLFEVAGVADGATWVGAAASNLACTRAKWYLGGRDDHVLPPAALLGAPTQPTPGLPDFYDAPEQRERTLDALKRRRLPFLDGKIIREGEAWRVDMVLRAADGAEVARAAASEGNLLARVIKEGVEKLWQASLLQRTSLDPEIARWTALPDVEAGLTVTDIDQAIDSQSACATIDQRTSALGNSSYPLRATCGMSPPDAGPPPLDESSPAGLATSALADLYSRASLPQSDRRRLAEKLGELRAAQPDHLGRAYLAFAAGTLWASLDEKDEAKAAFLATVAEDPLFFDAWGALADPRSVSGSSPVARALAATWFPEDPSFLGHAASSLSDDLAARIHDARLAYLLLPSTTAVLQLGRALAEASHEDEVRALTTITPLGRKSPDPAVVAMLLALIDLHDAKLASAVDHLEKAGTLGNYQLPIVSQILGRAAPISATWARAMLALPDDEARAIVSWAPSTLILCMNAGSGLSLRCLARAEKLGGSANTWGVNGGALLQGAKRYASGDLRGAVDAWRPIVGETEDGLVRLLPTEAFDRIGETDLAARIDARKMKYRYFAGISDATPREARRAFASGDRTRAKDLAQKVVDAWEVADAPIPAVADMRELLKKLKE